MTHTLSKSKLLAWRQCPKRLWLQIHRPELAACDEGAAARFEQGYTVEAVARSLYGDGPRLEFDDGVDAMIERTRALMASGEARIFEATFIHDGVMVKVDILERTNDAPPWRYRIVEVKSASRVKAVYLEDVAVQAAILDGAGSPAESVTLAHVDTSFVYPGNGDYRGLMREVPMDAAISGLRGEVPDWIRRAKEVVAGSEPQILAGDHCSYPYECPFAAHCAPAETIEFPVTILPRAGRVAAELQSEGFADLRDVPEDRLDREMHLRVREATVTGRTFVDPAAAPQLRALPYPRYYLDFETVQPALPRWAGTRPYQQLPFQWSLHVEHEDGTLLHHEFLDTAGHDPMREAMTLLIAAAGSSGPILVYSPFEGRILREMGAFLPDLAPGLDDLAARLFDLLPFMQAHYYHPAQKGSWSIKAVLPTIAPDLGYDGLAIGDGNAAQLAYAEMSAPDLAAGRREQIRRDLLAYCGRDTLGLVRLVQWMSQSHA